MLPFPREQCFPVRDNGIRERISLGAGGLRHKDEGAAGMSTPPVGPLLDPYRRPTYFFKGPQRDRESQIMNRLRLCVSTMKHRSELLKRVGFLILRAVSSASLRQEPPDTACCNRFKGFSAKKNDTCIKYIVISLLKFSSTH